MLTTAGSTRFTIPRYDVSSVGIAGSQTGVYPTTTPGGWRLIGRTPMVLFDPARVPPITYRPNATSNNTVFGLLLEASRALGFSVRYAVYEIPNGVLVTAINGSANGDGGRYWQYWVNGVYGAVSADHGALHDNDVVMWEFTLSQEGG